MQNKLASYSSILGVIVANKRKEKGIEQGEIAKKVGLSQASYSRLESGKSSFSFDQLFECAKALDVSVDELFQSVSNMVSNLNSSDEVRVQSQYRASTTKVREIGNSGHSNAPAFIAGAALAALIIGLLGKSK